MDLQQVSNGFGQILPHTILKLDAQGNPTQTVISIRTDDDLIKNATISNHVRPAPQFPLTAALPNGTDGNQFFYAEFKQDIDIDSVLDDSPGAQATSGLSGSITLVALDPTTGSALPVKARVLVNGFTHAGLPQGDPPLVPLQHWVQLGAAGRPEALDVGGATPGLGFPGTQDNFTGSQKLISPRTIVFVADQDGDLSTLESFPANRELKLRITTAVRATNGNLLLRSALACTTVGADVLRPEIATTPPPINSPVITPGQGDQNVDPLTSVRVEFTEPIEPSTLGSLPTGRPPVLSAAVRLHFGPSAQTVTVPFTIMPVSVFDLSTFDLTPSFNFPGEGPPGNQCGVYNRVDIVVNPAQFKDFAQNQNIQGANTFFITGEGPGIVNAPVSPDTIYLGRSGAVPGLSVIDLNGFGAATGSPSFDATYQTFPQGNSNYPNNPNLKLQGALLRPPLAPGTCTVNGGSAGVFRLSQDSSLQDLLVRTPVLTSVGDMMLGHSLDSAFNNGPAPFGCQAGGGNLCAFDGKKIINPVPNGNSMAPAIPGQINGIIGVGAENLCCWSPHPNPPPLNFPPICVSPFIGGQEPTSIDSTLGPPLGPGLTNLLAPGDYFGTPSHNIPPSGLLTPEQNAYFQGPSIEQATIGACQPFMIRQQVGQYMYVIDRGRREIVVLNTNRMTVIDRISTPDPTTLAMSPNVNLLAVVNQIGDLVSFIDIDPASSTFHQVVQETLVGQRPRGIAWEPGNEDIMVTNELDGTMSILSAASLTVRKVVSSQLSAPFDVAITPRQVCWGFARYVYFGYAINRNGRCAIFESGPNTVNGWGYDDVIGIASVTFRNPKAMQADQFDLRSAVWIVHEGPINLSNDQPGPFGTGAVSKLVIESGVAGVLPLNFQSAFIPQFRDLFLGVAVSIGNPDLSGVPVEIAFDNMRSLSGLVAFTTPFTTGTPIPINGKGMVRGSCPTGVANNSEPRYMFVAVPNPTSGTGIVDVVRIDQGFVRVDTNPFLAGIQSIPAPNVTVLMDYFRQ